MIEKLQVKSYQEGKIHKFEIRGALFVPDRALIGLATLDHEVQCETPAIILGLNKMNASQSMELLKIACDKESAFFECWNNLKDIKTLKEHSAEKRTCKIKYDN